MTAFRPQLRDPSTALSLLSRLPMPARAVVPDRMAQAAWAWPVAGMIVGAIAGAVGAASIWLGLPPAAAAGLVLVAQVMATGALHEDGLADTADGLWGGHTRERRLEIMKDSRIGSYGVLALVLVTGLRWAALAALASGGLWAAVIAAGAISRAPMVALSRRLPQARPGGLSAATGQPPRGAEALAALIALAASVLLCGLAALPALLVALALIAWLARLATARIGGQTGDILGASQQLAETGFLLALVAAQ